MATIINRVTRCDNHIHCGQSIEHTSEWPAGWGKVSLGTGDHKGYISSKSIELDLCPNCLTAVERAILTTLAKCGKETA